MKFNSWIERVGRSLKRGSSRKAVRPDCAVQASELLEERSLLSASTLFIAGELNVSLGPKDSVAIRDNPAVAGNILVVVNGTPVSNLSTVTASSVTKIIVNGGDDANLIDLSGVTGSIFNNPALRLVVNAGNGADTLLGSSDLADSLNGGDGDDSVVGNGGNDTLLGGDGNDSIAGGIGNDSVEAGDGRDTVDGNDGNDVILAGNGQDSVDGADGNDSISGDDGADTLNGGNGNDTLNGMAGADSIDGQVGDDSVLGGSGDDTLLGNVGNDTIDGQAGLDSILGGDGTDSLTGGDGNDSIVGEAGNDTLNGSAGNDTMVGNDGNDTLFGGGGHDLMFGDGTAIGSAGIGNDEINGQSGNDTLNGGGGGDTLNGGAGNDSISSGDRDSENGASLSAQDGADILELDNAATTSVTITIALAQALPNLVTVDYATANGSATAGQDYVATNGTLQFAPGVTTQTVTVIVNGDDLDESDENFFLNLTNPTGTFIFDSQGEVLIVDDDGWVAMGPSPITGGQTENVSPNDEVVGAVHVVAPHPTDPNIMLVGGVNGGIWRTTNAQATSPTWTPVTDQLSSTSIGAIAFDPTNPNRVVAGVGRHSSFGFDGGNLTGLFQSSDGGITWTDSSGIQLDGENISGVAIRGNTILASSDGAFGGGGLFHSTDGGTTFTAISGTRGLASGRVFDLVGDPSNPNRFYATVSSQGVFRTDDLGGTWTNASSTDPGINGSMTDPNFSNAEMAVANNGRLYTGVIISGVLSYIGYSDNQGLTWTAMDIPRTLEPDGSVVGLHPTNPRPANAVGGVNNRPSLPPATDGYAGGQGFIHFSIAADPTNPNIVYLGGDRQDTPFPNSIGAQNFSGRLFRGDASQAPVGAPNSPQWAHLTHDNNVAASPTGGTANGSSPHADSRDMAFDAAGNLIEGDDGGVYRRTSPRTNTGDWFSINGNLQISEQHSLGWDTVANIAISGNQDTGTAQQTATGSLTWEQVSQGDGGDIAVDTLAIAGQSIRYSSFQNLFNFRGQIFDAANNQVGAFVPALTVAGGGTVQGQFLTPVATNAVAGSRLLIAGGNGLYESTDRGQNVTNLSGAIIGNINALAYGGRRLGVSNPEVIYVGDGNRLFVRLAGTGAPTQVAFPGGFITGIAIDPDDFQTAFVTDQNSVWRTTNGGAAWINVTGSLQEQFRMVAYVPRTGANPDLVMAAGNLGVYRMDVTMPGQWREFGSGLANAPVAEIIYDVQDDLLVVSTMGRGTWQFVNASIGDFPSTLAPGVGINTIPALGDTINAGDGNDTVIGADGDDVILGDDGFDSLRGGAGNDSISGGLGKDYLEGGSGDDTLRGQGGTDTVIGGEGNDTYEWNATSDGDDNVSSTSGDDRMTVTTGGASDVVSVGKVGSKLKVTSGANELIINPTIRLVTIDTGTGDDTVTIGNISGITATVLTINTGVGDDTIDGSGGLLGNVRLGLNGGDGNDSITGTTNDDTIDGGAGIDTLLGGAGNDTMFGGTEADIINGQAGDDSILGGDGNDNLAGGIGNDVIRAGLGQDSVNGNEGADTLVGDDGRDTILGGAGNDSIDGGLGKDSLSGGDDNDTLDGGFNDDTITGDAGADIISGNHGNDLIDAGAGADTVNGGDGNDTISGGDDKDLLGGGDGDDVINGGMANDTIVGGDGKDSVLGGSGNDILFGNDGDDLLNGQGGIDTMSGGQGNDTLIGDLSEIIENFTISNDLLKKLELL